MVGDVNNTPCLGSGRGGDVRSRANGTEAILRWTSAAATAVVGASTSPSTGLTLSVMTVLSLAADEPGPQSGVV